MSSLLLVVAACTGASGPETSATPTTEIVVAGTSTVSTPSTTVGAKPATCPDTVPRDEVGMSLAFFAVCTAAGPGSLYPIFRPGRTQFSLQRSLELLVEGTTEEERALGLGVGFDWVDEADEIEVRAGMDTEGVLTVDFRLDGERWNPGDRAGTSTQLLSFLVPLQATVFSFPEVAALDNSTLCWGESSCSGVITREVWEETLFLNEGVLFHRGCDLRFATTSSGCRVDDVPVRTTATVVDVASGDTLNVRAGPGVDYFKIGGLVPGAPVEVLDASDVADDGGLWRLVRSGDGLIGWVNNAYLELYRTEEEALVDLFVAFAADPSEATFEGLPLADSVGLGLGPTVLKVVEAESLIDPTVWDPGVEEFRAGSGDFSPLSALARLDDYRVTVGSHPHCVSSPMDPPVGYEDMTRVSVQPVLGVNDSCLMWFTVDFFVNGAGKVSAITYDLYEP
ncbi:MAG: SH3 domain-containing protein [Acidimicrobiia bacterium]